VKYDILIAGVGGQGVVLASRMLALAAMKAGLHVSTAETIGMSQREGSVSSHIRIGNEVSGSLIPVGQADLLLGLEPAETVRNLLFLGKSGKVLVNTHAIPPASKLPGSPNYDPVALLSFLNVAALASSALISRSLRKKQVHTGLQTLQCSERLQAQEYYLFRRKPFKQYWMPKYLRNTGQ
jgi:indolepyruvate ferredoxin oxidoreductase beta subunit